MKERRFNNFSDDEIYVLSRQAIEASAEIILMNEHGYSIDEQKIHQKLMNELLQERKFRD